MCKTVLVGRQVMPTAASCGAGEERGEQGQAPALPIKVHSGPSAASPLS